MHWFWWLVIVWGLSAFLLAPSVGRALRKAAWERDHPCVCGCVYQMHQHYRQGIDCGECGYVKCPAYRPAELRI